MSTASKVLLLVLLCAAPAFAQNVRVDNVTFSSVQGFPFLPGATITICTAAATGLPCSPTVTGTCLSITDTTCNQSATLTSDSLGNYGFWIQPGSYSYTVTKAGFGGFGPKALTLSCQLASTCTTTGPQTFTGVSSVNGAFYVSTTGTYTTVQAAVTAACALSPVGSTVYVPSGTWVGPTTWCSGIHVIGTGSDVYTATLVNALSGLGGAAPTTGLTTLQYTTTSGLTLANLYNVHVNNVRFDFQSVTNSTNMTFQSVFGSTFDDVLWDNCSNQNFCLNFTASAIANSDASQNTFKHILTSGGSWSVGFTGNNNSSELVTLNYFISAYLLFAQVGGINFVAHCDSNGFENVRVVFNVNNFTGIMFNGSATPNSDVGVRTEWLHYIDFTGLGSPTGGTGIVVNASYGDYFQTGEITGLATLISVNQSASPASTYHWSAIGGSGTGDFPFEQAPSFRSTANNIAQSGLLRAASGDSVFVYRNNANTGDLPMTKTSSDNLVWNNQGSGLFSGFFDSKWLQLEEQATPIGGAVTVGILSESSDDHMLHYNPNNAGVQQVPLTAFVTSTYTNATTTFSTVTNMSFPVAASRNYTMACRLYFQGSATTAGPKFQLTGPSAPTAVTLGIGPFDPIAKTTTNVVTAFSTANTAFGTIGALGVNYVADVTGGIVNGVNAGTVVLQAAANGAGTLTIQPGSYCVFQ